MEPVGLGKKGDKYIIYYYCQRCGYKFQVKVASNDNFKEMLKLNSKKI